MAVIDIQDWPSALPTAAIDNVLNVMRHGVAPVGAHHQILGQRLNALLGRKKKVLFRKSIEAAQVSTSTGDVVTWVTAFHTGPITSELGIDYVYVSPLNANQSSNPYAYWATETGLAGTGTTAAAPKLYCADNTTGTPTTPGMYRHARQVTTVTADTDYRAELHTNNGARVLSCTLYELRRDSVDTATDTDAADTTRALGGLVIDDVASNDVLSAGSAWWRRGQPAIFSWCQAAGAAVTRTSATLANICDQTVTAYSAASPGFAAVPHRRHSGDSTSVGCMFWCKASQAAGSGSVRLVGQNGTLATIAISGATATWYSAAFNLLGTDATDKLDVLIAGSGAADVAVYAAGAFFYNT